MSLTYHTLYEGPQLRIQRICCRPESAACGAEEHAPAHLLALPVHGVFVKHHEHGGDLVTSAGHALFFNAGESYRVSHPTGYGDDCLVLEPQETALREMLATFDEKQAWEGRRVFQRSHVTLAPPAFLAARSLLTAVAARAAALTVEVTSLDLFASVLADAHGHDIARAKVDRRACSRRRDQVRAAAVALASRPDLEWTLPQLARQVHASQFHLARAFRSETGESIHECLLRARLASALEAVLDSDEALTEIAARLGFATPSHLSAAFRKRYGVAPSALRGKLTRPVTRQLRTILTAPGRSRP